MQVVLFVHGMHTHASCMELPIVLISIIEVLHEEIQRHKACPCNAKAQFMIQCAELLPLRSVHVQVDFSSAAAYDQR